MNAEDVLHFWFDEVDPKQWWRSDPDFDQLITQRFGELHQQALQGALSTWRTIAPGCLAEVIVLDQFSRNIYRGEAEAFRADPLALQLAADAVDRGMGAALPPVQRAFLYMPFMHSEDPAMHERAMALFSEPGLEPNLAAEVRHKAIIDRFGRYPHRNAILGRVSTPEEDAFLKTPGSSF